MRIAVVSTSQLLTFKLPAESEVEIIYFNAINGIVEINNYDGLIHIGNDAYLQNYNAIQIPVFINSVNETLAGKAFPDNVVRMNGWPGFIEKSLWELSGTISSAHESLLKALGKQWIVVPDIIGFISCRVIAMIINEAFFTVESGVSTEEDINIAMRLGTNYPFGPFEWADLIGRNQLYQLLLRLAESDSRYKPCASLAK